jgi:Transglutaminase-like superfamily
MQIRAGYELIYDCSQQTPMVLLLTIHHTRANDIIVPDRMIAEPFVPLTSYRDGFGNWCTRILAPAGRLRLSASSLLTDTGKPDTIAIYQDARSTRTAWDTLQEGTGVCRDYAHLAIAFCRCMNIPARYCTGYLGDIGVAPPDGPMDFAAWFEAYIGGRWQTFDPRNNVPRIGRVLIARGRDATDVAISNTFGPNTLAGFRVWTDEVKRPLGVGQR